MKENNRLKKKRIILLGPYPPPYGGVATFNQTLYEHLEPHGAIIWAHTTQPPTESHVRHFNLNIFKTIQILVQEGRRATILDSSVFLLDWPNKKLILILFILKPFLKCRWIKMVHSGILPNRFSRFSRTQRFFFHLATSLIDEYITVNDELSKWLTRTLKQKENIHVIPSLLPHSAKMFTATLSPDIKKELLGCPQLIISIGAFLPNYGFKEIIEAVETIRNNSDLKPTLVLLEVTFATDAEYKRNILKNRDWTIVYTDIPQPQVFQILKLGNVFVRATSEESYGLSKIESLWCGTPVASTRQGETRGMVVFDKESPAQMEQTIENLLLDPGLDQIQRYAELFKNEARQNLDCYLTHLGLAHE